jgi:hypothetical protein
MTEKNYTEQRNMIIAVLVAALTILFVLLVSLLFSFDLVQNLVISWIFTTLYAVFAFFLVGNSVRVVERRIFVEKPVEVVRTIVKEVPVAVQIPVENKTIEVVDRPVFRDRVKIVRPQVRKLTIPRYDFVASTQTRRYHRRKCRLGKLIKKKYKIQNNSQAFFKKKKYRPCKACINKKKK